LIQKNYSAGEVVNFFGMSFFNCVDYETAGQLITIRECNLRVTEESNNTTLPPDDFEEDIFHPASADGL